MIHLLAKYQNPFIFMFVQLIYFVLLEICKELIGCISVSIMFTFGRLNIKMILSAAIFNCKAKSRLMLSKLTNNLLESMNLAMAIIYVLY